MENVCNIHHVHSWMSDEKTIYFEAHIDMDDIPLSDITKVYNMIEHLLIEYYGISHFTLQAEVNECCDMNIFKKKI